ncbi:DNA/RNA nuclease SfsA [Wenzhouxiangella sp. XN79A]|uniref:DNA/RNA nuclease SfsA n=1 Tax=Wenzhouxiangella sp. XN79A TaxID=2724193 RepID=UPI00197CE6C2|nr:DNA/RNA nuclease SfsA [Wenzhouxiangella sp. XN79A]
MSPLIPHTEPLHECRLVARYDRFVADVEFEDGRIEKSHCVNPGRMEGLVRPGARAWVSAAPEGSTRKLRWTLELLELDGRYVGANTQAPNRIAEALIRARLVPGLKRWRSLEREVRYGENSRIDLLLRGATDHLVEVKNCHLVYPDRRAYFPDSVSARATKHLHELVQEVDAGRRATVLFVLQRTDGLALRPSRVHDPDFADAARAAADAGVRFRAVRIDPGPEGFRFAGTLPVDLSDYDPAGPATFRSELDAWSGWKRRGPVRRAV